jgi:signal transduction histidine kinase
MSGKKKMRGPEGSTVAAVVLTGVVIALVAGMVATRLIEDFATRSPSVIFLLNFSYWIIWTLLTPAVLFLGRRFRFVAGGRIRALAVHVVSGFFFATAHVGLYVIASMVIGAVAGGEPLAESWSRVSFPTRMHIEWELTIYWALVGLAQALEYSREARERAVVAAELEAKLAQAQLQVLHQQLHPHFLFNTLQSIAALVHRDQNEADRMIERLADLLRLTLGAGNAGEVPLRRELEHVACYLDIERANMGSRLQVSTAVDADTLSAAVPTLLLQPIVENAVRHGIAPRASGGLVTIHGRREGDLLELHVVDNGVGLSANAQATGIGIANTRQRLARLYGSRQMLTISPNPVQGVTVTIRLPFRAVGALPPVEAVACPV